MRYPVSLTRDDNDTFLVRFPDVPEAVTFGGTRVEALARAVDALLTVIDAYMKDRRDIPMPSAVVRRPFVEVPVLDSAKIELYRVLRHQNVGKAELAKRLHWHLPQVDRVLRMKHGSRLEQVEDAFRAVGKRIVLLVEDGDTIPPGGSESSRREPGRMRSSASVGRHREPRQRRAQTAHKR